MKPKTFREFYAERFPGMNHTGQMGWAWAIQTDSPGAALDRLANGLADYADHIARAQPVPTGACTACGGMYPNPNCGHIGNATYERKSPPCRPEYSPPLADTTTEGEKAQ